MLGIFCDICSFGNTFWEQSQDHRGSDLHSMRYFEFSHLVRFPSGPLKKMRSNKSWVSIFYGQISESEINNSLSRFKIWSKTEVKENKTYRNRHRISQEKKKAENSLSKLLKDRPGRKKQRITYQKQRLGRAFTI